jgi:hypothetical protein
MSGSLNHFHPSSLRPHPCFSWWRQDSNLRPDDYRSSALPTELRHLKCWLRSLDLNQNYRGQSPASYQLNDSAKIVGAAGLEPASRANPALAAYKTAALPLSYAPKNICGGRDRTFNLSGQSRAPCQFGYSAIIWRLVVDSHHSLRLFRPTLELSQLPSRVNVNVWWLEPDSHRRPDVYETFALLA